MVDVEAEGGGGATARGLVAVLLWSGLATLTAASGAIPPLQLAAMSFSVGTVAGLIRMLLRGERFAVLKVMPAGALVLGIYGLLGFHVCYFFALQNAPPVPASLIVYLWPLLIVILSAFLPGALGGKGLGWWHVTGAALGFAGCVMLLAGGGWHGDISGAGAGFALAFAAALIWSTYSVASRLFAGVPSSSLIVSCAATAVAAALLHAALETTRWPASATGWLAIGALGAGPVGLAFYLWDEGMKRGNIRMLGVAAYFTPLLSTLLLIAFGLGVATPRIWAAAALIVLGALLAGADTIGLIKKKAPRPDRGASQV